MHFQRHPAGTVPTKLHAFTSFRSPKSGVRPVAGRRTPLHVG